jgi:NO-binding membrane sensor protein with MHYT domain
MYTQVDIRLYALSVFIAMLSFFTAFVLTNGIIYTKKKVALSRIILSALCIGVGIWAAFLISAISLNLPVLIDINNLAFLIPLGFAILSFLISLRLLFFYEHRRAGFWISSFVMNSGFNVVYISALNADCLSCQTTFDLLAFAGLVAAGFLFSLTALRFASRQRGVLETFVGSVLMGGFAAIVNYIGLKAFGITQAPLPGAWAHVPAGTQFYVALSLAAAAYLICGFAIVIHWNQDVPRLTPPVPRRLLQHQSGLRSPAQI